MLKRKLFTADHEQFRDTARKFFEREIMPHHERWEEQGFVDRDAWLKAGAAGLLCMTMPEAYGGVGVDRLYSTVMIEEAARVDGASTWQSFWRVLLPMALPILMVVFLLAFIGAIIEYPVASVLLTQQDQLTLAVGSKLFVHEHNFHWGDFAAAAILSGLPITVVFLLAQRWMIAGLAAGGVKG